MEEKKIICKYKYQIVIKFNFLKINFLDIVWGESYFVMFYL